MAFLVQTFGRKNHETDNGVVGKIQFSVPSEERMHDMAYRVHQEAMVTVHLDFDV
jgi:hypothetical protein